MMYSKNILIISTELIQIKSKDTFTIKVVKGCPLLFHTSYTCIKFEQEKLQSNIMLASYLYLIVLHEAFFFLKDKLLCNLSFVGLATGWVAGWGTRLGSF